MRSITMEVEKRELGTKAEIKSLRRNDYIPLVIYGKNHENFNGMITKINLNAAFREGLSEATILNLKLGAEKKDALGVLKAIQRHPVTEDIIHMDLNFIAMDQSIHTHIPIVLVGQAQGAKLGGIVEHILREIEIEALPGDIPNQIEVNVTDLGLNQSIHVSDLKVEKIKILTDPKLALVKVQAPQEVDTTTVEEETAEPEVIEKGKKETEE